MKQTKLDLQKGRWGGRRKGCGRKRKHSPGVAHRERETITRRTPAHVNMKYNTPIKNKDFLRVLKRAILNSRKKGLRILHYSVQSNHIHFIIEADDNQLLERGMRSLTVTLVKGINKGKTQLQRYHLHVLRSPRETRNAVRYVAFNEKKHTGRTPINSYSSACLLLKVSFDYCVTKMDRGRSYLMSRTS